MGNRKVNTVSKKVELTPIMMQFYKFKESNPDAIFLARNGDFYEAYENDAEICAEILGIVLTTRLSDKVRMVGFPHHALDMYLPKLVSKGKKRIAICEPLEYPDRLKGKKKSV